jgi:CheY-like chemotaxis protein
MKKIILLIDDDQDEFDFYNDALRIINFPGNLIHAASAAQALTLLSYVIPDYIFVDYNMPRMNGLQCLEEIKKINSLQHVPVIISSTNIDDELAQHAKLLGASCCIRKSLNVRALADMLQQIFAVHKQRLNGLFSIFKPN